MTTKNRIIAGLMSNSTSKVKEIYLDSDAVNTSATLSAAIGTGTTTYSSIDLLPVSSNNGDQALITSTNRLYIFSNGGWYNIALINTTPYWNTEANSSYELNTDGTSTTITLLAVDSEGLPITYIATADSDFNQIATVTKDSDNGRVFIVTPTDSENGTAIAGTGTVTFKASDGVNLATTLSTFSILFKIENSNYTSFLLKADAAETNNQVDTSTNAHTITEYGNVTSTAFTPYHPGGYSWYWAGDGGDYFTITSPTSALSFGTGDFCVEMWIYPFDVSSSILLDMRPASTNGSYIGAFGFVSGNLGLGFNGLDSSQTGFVTSGAPVSTYKWHHIVLNRESGTSNIFVNGVREYTTTTEYNFLVGRFSLFINAFPGGGVSDGTGGYIRDYRVVKGSSVYGTGTTLTVPTKPLTVITGTSLLLFQEPYISDAVGTESISFVGGVTKRFSPYDYEKYTEADYGGSVYLDGVGDYLRADAALDSLTSTTSSFTIEYWFHSDGSPSSFWAIAGINNSSYDNVLLIGHAGASSGRPEIYYDSTLVTVGVARLNQWQHIAVTYDGTTIKMYQDGISIYSNNMTPITAFADCSLLIGAEFDAGASLGNYPKGYISDFRIVSDVVYTSEFIPPTAPLTAITNTELLTCTNKNDIWEQADGGPVMTKVGNVTASNAQRNFLTSSAMYFDGNGDYIDFVKKDSYSFESGVDFTVEGWWYMNSVAGRPHFIGMGTGIDATPAHYSDWNMYYNSSNQLTFYYYDGSTAIARTFAWTPVIETWYHIAVSRSGTDLKAFVNGSQIGSTITDSTNFSGAAGSRPLRIGRWQYGGGINAYLNGYAQDIRITKGRAVYDSDFTPPTAEFNG